MPHNEIILPETVDIPVPLYKSLQGRYFVGHTPDLDFSGEDMQAWASLYNPPDSGVNMFVNVWTVTSYYSGYRAELRLNARMPGRPSVSCFFTPTNTTLNTRPKALITYAEDVTGEPHGGVFPYLRVGDAFTTLVSEEDSKFIIGEGGSFSILLSHPDMPKAREMANIAFGWSEKPLHECN